MTKKHSLSYKIAEEWQSLKMIIPLVVTCLVYVNLVMFIVSPIMETMQQNRMGWWIFCFQVGWMVVGSLPPVLYMMICFWATDKLKESN